MPIDQKAQALITHQLQAAKRPFEAANFKSIRDQWLAILHRRHEVKWEDDLKRWGGGIDLQTPDVEYFFSEHVKILGIGQTEVSTNALDTSQEARKDIEDVAVWKQAWLYQINEANNISQSMSSGQTALGIWVGRILWDKEGEYTWPDQDKDESIPDYASRSLRERNNYYSLSSHHEFKVVDVDPLQCYWGPKLDDPDVVFQECRVPFWEYRQLKDEANRFVGLDEAASSIVWLGDPEPIDGDRSGADRYVRVVYRAMREPGTTHWTMTEYVYPDGGDFIKDGEVLKEYDVPAQMCPFVFVASGEEQVRETDPHLRYRPKLYRTYVHAMDWNYLRSLIGRPHLQPQA